MFTVHSRVSLTRIYTGDELGAKSVLKKLEKRLEAARGRPQGPWELTEKGRFIVVLSVRFHPVQHPGRWPRSHPP